MQEVGGEKGQVCVYLWLGPCQSYTWVPMQYIKPCFLNLIQSNCIFLLISLNVTISWINKLLLKWKKVLTSKFFLRCGISSLNKNLVFSLNINNHYAFPTLFPLITIQEHTKKTNYPSFHQHTPKSYTNARFPFPQVFLRL